MKEIWPSGKVKVCSAAVSVGGCVGAVVGATAGTVRAGLGFGAGTDADTDGLADVVGVAEAEALGVGIASVEATVTAGAGLELTEPKLAATRRPAVTAAAPSNNTCNLRLATPAVVQGGHTRTREAVAEDRGPGQDSVQGLFPDPAPPLDR